MKSLSALFFSLARKSCARGCIWMPCRSWNAANTRVALRDHKNPVSNNQHCLRFLKKSNDGLRLIVALQTETWASRRCLSSRRMDFSGTLLTKN